MSYLTFSTKIAAYLVNKTKLPRHMEEVLAYAVEVLSLNILNLGSCLIIGYFLGVLNQTIICLVCVSAIRIFAGGAHSNSPWRCAIITALVFPAMGVTSNLLAQVGQLLTDTLLIVSCVIGFLTLYFLSPVESLAAPIISNNRRTNLKRMSLFSFALILIIVAYFRFYVAMSIEIQLSFALGILWISFILTPFGHVFFILLDQIVVKKPQGKEVNKQ
ncbi:MAG TPA: accessory regulator AgrB [Desulfotomaculum sp.]|nr:MAG: hypothetical protein JL56_06360 [Desulfotomaculum sp. BICA1-6]HBX24623.1 accessory regulator AgrB [Desulfotomaculum sp.]